MTVIALPKILREKLTDEGTDALVQILDKIEERSQKATLEITEERFEKRLAQVEANLKTEIAETKAELMTEIANTKAEIRTEIVNTEARLMTEITNTRVKIANTRANLIKWMFIFWIGQFASIVGVLTAILFAFFKR